jgi:hypothetical protein
MQLLLNDKFVCNSTATYGGKDGTVTINGTEWQTISSMSECQEPFRVKTGDSISMKSFYNTTKHPLYAQFHPVIEVNRTNSDNYRRESDGFKMEEMGMFSIAFAPLS